MNYEKSENLTEAKSETRRVITSAANDHLHCRNIPVRIQSDNVTTEGRMLQCGDLFKYSRVCDEYQIDVLVHRSCAEIVSTKQK